MEVTETSKVEKQVLRVTLQLKPISVLEDGLQAPLPPPSSIELRVLPSGGIEEVVSNALLSPGSPSSLEVSALLTEHRPPLPHERVHIGDTWRAPLQVASQPTRIDLAGEGRLEGFELVDRRRAAAVSISRGGTVTSTVDLGRAPVNLEGKVTSKIEMLMDIDRGQILESTSRSTTRYSMSFQGGGSAGTMVTTITGKLELLEGASN